MKSPEYYKDREQTYLKHFLLEHYLERVAYNICSFRDQFVYVEGFSGPWKSADPDFEDTSFKIALNQLRKVRDTYRERNRKIRIRCLFVEKRKKAFNRLRGATSEIEDIEISVIHGKFEDKIQEILQFIGDMFSLVFIDPTGWKGLPLVKIKPLLQHQPGEVIVNFMYDHINRFSDSNGPALQRSFDELFGRTDWREVLKDERRREERILELYKECIRKEGAFDHVTSTRILKPTADRSYFHIIYGTRHLKGLQEFRGVEERFVEEQEKIRYEAKEQKRTDRTGQPSFSFEYEDESTDSPSIFFEQDKQQRLIEATRLIEAVFSNQSRIRYIHLLAKLLEIPFVWEKDVRALIDDLGDKNEIAIEGLRPRERTLKAEERFYIVKR